MSIPASDMPNLVPISTQNETSSSTLAVSSLDVIAITPQAMSLRNNHSSCSAGLSGTETSHSPEHRLRHYEAMWHPKAGLIVSPNVSHLPRNVPQDLEDGSDCRKYSQPKLLRDDEIYLAFQPRFARNDGALFGRLNFSREALSQNICPLRNGKFVLPDDLIVQWTRLEDSFLDVADILLSAKPGLPRLTYPKLPWQFGYRDAHASRDVTLRCAVRSRDAFMELSAVVSFALSLHLDDSGDLGFAFLLVRQRSSYKPARAWFDLLSNSYVCNFSPHFRVGGFVNPYTCTWMSYIPKFVQTNVPVWVFWGYFHKITYPVDVAAFKYSPPDYKIEDAKARAGVTSTLILPIYRYDPFSMSHGLPLSSVDDVNGDDPMGTNDANWAMTPLPMMESAPTALALPPPSDPSHDYEVEAARKEKALAALEEYFGGLERVRELRLGIERPDEKQQRESWEQYANTHHMYSKTCKVYEWREQDDGKYERVKLDSTDYDTAWGNYTRNQRRFVGHLNTWELCPQLPRYSEKHPKENEPWNDARSEYYSDDESQGEDDTPRAPETSSLKLPPAYKRPDTDTVYIDDLRELAAKTNGMRDEQSTSQQLNASCVELFNFAAFVKGRFGYDIFSPAGWSTKIEPSAKTKNISLKNSKMALSFNKIPGGRDVEEAVINLVRILSNPTWTFTDLPSAFDHCDARGTSLESDTLQVAVVSGEESTKYLVYKKGYVDKCPWGIYMSEASTVLLIFRNQWRTTDIIARELVARGIPFHTVFAAEAPPVTPPPTPVRGLGERPLGYEPMREDYMEYLRRREDLLNGSKGRAALMHGGIIARIARDVLDQHTILDGPSSGAVTVGKHQRFNLYDDKLDDNDLDIICGVYYVDVENPPNVKNDVSAEGSYSGGTKAHMSYWPKDGTWTAMAAYLRVEWTEKAEAFYQNRLEKLKNKPELFTASSWRKALRLQNVVTKEIEFGAEHYQSGYLEHRLRQSRFVAERR